jgi:hypothetical protein
MEAMPVVERDNDAELDAKEVEEEEA